MAATKTTAPTVTLKHLSANVAEGHELGDTTTLRDPDIVEELKAQADAKLGRGGDGSSG